MWWEGLERKGRRRGREWEGKRGRGDTGYFTEAIDELNPEPFSHT